MSLEDFTDVDDDESAEPATSAEAADPATEASTADGAEAPSDSGSRQDTDDEFTEYPATVDGEDVGLGALSVNQGLRVSEEADDTTIRAFVTANNREAVRLGKYILVPYPDNEQLFCRIAALEYAQEFQSDDATEIHARRMMRQSGIEERDYKFMAELDPVAVLYDQQVDGETELKRRMTDRVPKPGANVQEATDSSEIKTGLSIPEDGVFLGHLSVGGEKVETAAQPPHIDYRLKDDYEAGDPLVFRHTLVAGGTGSGKTHGSKNILRQYLGENRAYPMDDGRTVRPAVVQFDPQDEYAQMHDDNPELGSGYARRLDREGIAYGGVDDTIALVPKEDGTSYGGENHRAERVEFTIPFRRR